MKKWLVLLVIIPSLWAFERSQGFQSLESEVLCEELKIEGEIPTWVNGTYVRNGPSKFTALKKSVSHWFDGLAMLHQFHIEKGSCTYTNRFLRTNDYQYMMNGSLPTGGFSRSSSPHPMEILEGEFYPKRPNAVVNVALFDKTAVALTEAPTPVTFDLESLETLGTFQYDDTLPQKNCYATAHPQEIDGKTYGYLIEIGKHCQYIFYELKGNSRKKLASIPVTHPSYIHSFSITDHYIVFIDYPLRLDFEALINGAGFIQSFKWDDEGKTRFYVIDRAAPEHIKTIEGPPFFSFHHINAYEEDDSIIIDLIGHKNSDVIQGEEGTLQGWKRYRIKDDEITTIHTELLDAELPRINYERHNGKPYRYFYATCFRRNVAEVEAPPLYKVDTEQKKIKTWSLRGYFASEPVFLPNPNGKREDDGVILSVVTNRSHTESFLLVLDGITFEEKARAYAPHGIPQGLHGQFFR